MKHLFLALLLFAFSLFAAEDIQGYWKTINEKTNRPECILAVYSYEGLYYGRILATFNEKGEVKDSIYKPVSRAPGVIGDPFYSGLDIIWDLYDSGSKFKGKILDPEKGNVYKSELWLDADDKLVVRGKFLMFGRSQVWLRVVQSDLPKGFELPKLNTLVPAIPETK